jgi:hypothetical protein
MILEDGRGKEKRKRNPQPSPNTIQRRRLKVSIVAPISCPWFHWFLDFAISLTKKSVMTLLYASLAELKSPLEKRNGKKKKTKQKGMCFLYFFSFQHDITSTLILWFPTPNSHPKSLINWCCWIN